MDYEKLELRDPEPVDENVIESDRLVDIPEMDFDIDGMDAVIQDRRTGPFQGKAIYLMNRFDWVLGKDESGIIVLIPLRKE